jgi:aminoglycoside 2''-phosphotransferase
MMNKQQVDRFCHDRGISVHSIACNDQGQNNHIIEVNGEWIFKFPRHEGAARVMKRECSLLRAIAPYIHGLQIPVPEVPVPEFSVHRKIQGTSMSRAQFDLLSHSEQLAAARQIAAFLRELHSVPEYLLLSECIPLSTADKAYWQDFLRRMEIHVFPHIRPDAAAEIRTAFSRFLGNSVNFQFTPVLVHGDLGAVNIIYEKSDGHSDSAGRVSGVIDFGQTCLGDPAADIASLICPRSFGDGFADLLRQVWEEDVDFDILLARARFYISTFALQDALFGAEYGDEEAFQDGISQYI